MDKAEKEMLEEMALRNAIARFRHLSKKGAIPEVGLFWIDDKGTLFAQTVSLREAVDYGEFRIFEGSHYEVWKQAIRANPKWEGREYEEVPRGRVVYRRDPKKPEFIVYLSKRILKFKGKVIDRFNLPAGHTRIDTSDEHYRL